MVVYTTNAIESLNASYRKLNRQRSVFPRNQAYFCIHQSSVIPLSERIT
ncbi:transposase [Ruminobacter sp.]